MADSEEVSVSNDSEPLLSVRHLRKSYGDHEVLKDCLLYTSDAADE